MPITESSHPPREARHHSAASFDAAAHENQTLIPEPIGFLIELRCVSESGVHYYSTAERIAVDLYTQYPFINKMSRLSAFGGVSQPLRFQ